MDIFESLEQLNVSEECFDDIVTMVEAMINEVLNPYTGQGEKSAKLYKKELMKKYKPDKKYEDGDDVYQLDWDKPENPLRSKLEKVKSAVRHHKKEDKKLKSQFKKSISDYNKAYDTFNKKYPEYDDSIDTYAIGSKEDKDMDNAKKKYYDLQDELDKNSEKWKERSDYKKALQTVLDPTHVQGEASRKGGRHL